MKGTYAGLIVMTLGLLGIVLCVVANKPVDSVVMIFFLIGMIWSLFSTLFMVHNEKEHIGIKSLIIIFTPTAIGVIFAMTGASASFYIALCGLFVLSTTIVYLNRRTNSK